MSDTAGVRHFVFERWLSGALGTGWAPVVKRRLNHQLADSPVYAVEARSPQGTLHRFVLKLFPADQPEAAAAEVGGIAIARRACMPVPEVIAADDGRAFGTPCVLMTRLPGRVVIRPRDGWPWFAGRLPDVLATIHRADLGSTSLGMYEPHDIDKSYAPPSNVWSAEAWEHCLQVFRAPPPDGPVGFLHRDFHAGNLIWSSSGRLSGVVDWAAACIGSPWADVAHLRFNLWRWQGKEAADAVVAEYQRLRPDLPPYHPYWDIATAMSIPWPNREPVLWSAVTRLLAG